MRWRVVAWALGAAACADGEAPPADWSEVASILGDRCVACHVDGGDASPPLDTPAGVLAARDAVTAILMGPGRGHAMIDHEACPDQLPTRPDIATLTPAEVTAVLGWLGEGAPGEGAATASWTTAEFEAMPDGAVAFPAVPQVVGSADEVWCFTIPASELSVHTARTVQLIPEERGLLRFGVIALMDHVDGEEPTVARCDPHRGTISPQIVHMWSPGTSPAVLPAASPLVIPSVGGLVIEAYPTEAAVGRELRLSVSLGASNPGTTRLELAAMGSFGVPPEPMVTLQPGPADPASGPAFEVPVGVADHRESWQVVISEGPGLVVSAIGVRTAPAGGRVRVDGFWPDGSSRCVYAARSDPFWERLHLIELPEAELPVFGLGFAGVLSCDFDTTATNTRWSRALEREGLETPEGPLLLGPGADEVGCTMHLVGAAGPSEPG